MGPEDFKGGRKVNELCQQFDIVPALFELAGVKVPEGWEARSLFPFLQGDQNARGRTTSSRNSARIRRCRVPSS